MPPRTVTNPDGTVTTFDEEGNETGTEGLADPEDKSDAMPDAPGLNSTPPPNRDMSAAGEAVEQDNTPIIKQFDSFPIIDDAPKAGGSLRNVSVDGAFRPAELSQEEAFAGVLGNAALQARLEQRIATMDEEFGLDTESKELLKATKEVFGPEEASRIIDEFLPSIRDRFDKLETDVSDIMAREVNPVRIFENGGGVSAALSVAAGTLSQSILGPNTPNAAAAIIQSALDRDFAAQVTNKKLGIQAAGMRGDILHALRGTIQDELAVDAAMRGLQSQVLAEQALILRGKVQSEGAKAGLDRIIADLQAKSMNLMKQARAQVGSEGLKFRIAKLTQRGAGTGSRETIQSLTDAFQQPVVPGQPLAAPARPSGGSVTRGTRPAGIGGQVRGNVNSQIGPALESRMQELGVDNVQTDGSNRQRTIVANMLTHQLGFVNNDSRVFFNNLKEEMRGDKASPEQTSQFAQTFIASLPGALQSRQDKLNSISRRVTILEKLSSYADGNALVAALLTDGSVAPLVDQLGLVGDEGREIISAAAEFNRLGSAAIIPLSGEAQDRANIGRFSDRDLQLLTNQIFGPLKSFRDGKVSLQTGPTDLKQFFTSQKALLREGEKWHSPEAWLRRLGLQNAGLIQRAGQDGKRALANSREL